MDGKSSAQGRVHSALAKTCLWTSPDGQAVEAIWITLDSG